MPCSAARPAVLLAALVALGGCGRASAAPREPGVVAIGVLAHPARPGLAAVLRAATLAVETLNAEPAARRAGVRFALHPTPAGVTSAVVAAERLRDDAAVVGIVGDTESGRTLDALPIIEDAARGGERALVAVSPSATSTTLAHRSAWLFRLSPDDGEASRTLATYVADSLGARQAAVVFRADSYGRDWAQAFARAYRARGGAVVARDPYLTGVTQWPAYARYLATRQPDAVLFPGSAEDAAPFIRALRDAGVRAPFVGGDAVAPLADSAAYAGVRFAATFTAERALAPGAPAAGRQFVERYAARYGTRPGMRAATAYEATLLIGRAALATGPAAPDRRARVRDWLVALGRTTPAAEGVVGPISFDPSHGVVGRTLDVTVAGAVSGSAPAPIAR